MSFAEHALRPHGNVNNLKLFFILVLVIYYIKIYMFIIIHLMFYNLYLNTRAQVLQILRQDYIVYTSYILVVHIVV